MSVSIFGQIVNKTELETKETTKSSNYLAKPNLKGHASHVDLFLPDYFKKSNLGDFLKETLNWALYSTLITDSTISSNRYYLSSYDLEIIRILKGKYLDSSDEDALYAYFNGLIRPVKGTEQGIERILDILGLVKRYGTTIIKWYNTEAMVEFPQVVVKNSIESYRYMIQLKEYPYDWVFEEIEDIIRLYSLMKNERSHLVGIMQDECPWTFTLGYSLFNKDLLSNYGGTPYVIDDLLSPMEPPHICLVREEESNVKDLVGVYTREKCISEDNLCLCCNTLNRSFGPVVLMEKCLLDWTDFFSDNCWADYTDVTGPKSGHIVFSLFNWIQIPGSILQSLHSPNYGEGLPHPKNLYTDVKDSSYYCTDSTNEFNVSDIHITVEWGIVLSDDECLSECKWFIHDTPQFKNISYIEDNEDILIEDAWMLSAEEGEGSIFNQYFVPKYSLMSVTDYANIDAFKPMCTNVIHTLVEEFDSIYPTPDLGIQFDTTSQQYPIGDTSLSVERTLDWILVLSENSDLSEQQFTPNDAPDFFESGSGQYYDPWLLSDEEGAYCIFNQYTESYLDYIHYPEVYDNIQRYGVDFSVNVHTSSDYYFSSVDAYAVKQLEITTSITTEIYVSFLENHTSQVTIDLPWNFILSENGDLSECAIMVSEADFESPINPCL